MDEVSRCVMKSILTIARHSATTDAASLFNALKSLFDKWKPLLSNYYKTKESQVQAMLAIEDEVTARENLFGPCLQKMVHYLYEVDVLSEEAILEWFEQLNDKLKPKLTNFIEWLKDAEEESDDD
uniref:W2 domain-containing protein n=1 Tax=Plectus sambesii TaxID=2011161 RepID=A0A914V3J9_9BILA